jgi:hypothetical protein
MSQPKQPFQVGDKVIYVADPDHVEHVLACEWVDAPVPHWRVETIFSVAGGEHHRIADASEFRHAPSTSRPDDIAPASMSVATRGITRRLIDWLPQRGAVERLGFLLS